MSRNKIRKNQQKHIALHRITVLFKLAEQEALKGHLHRSDRYVALARKIAMKTNSSIPTRFKRCFCKQCYRYLLPGITGRYRINHGKIIIYCSNCKHYYRIPLNPKKRIYGYSRI